MASTSGFLAATLGRVAPRYRTLAQWAVTYRQIIDSRQICDKTKANRRSALAHLMAGMGDRTISAIRPHEIAGMIQRIAA